MCKPRAKPVLLQDRRSEAAGWNKNVVYEDGAGGVLAVNDEGRFRP